MSSGKKHQKKRKRHSSPIKSQIAIRLEKLRGRPNDLWDDDDDEKMKPSNIIVLSESEEERPILKRKSRKKISSKNTTCLICSILSQLSSFNCCSEHLSLLKNHSHQPNPQWLPDQVMILPVTNEIVQRYLDPQQIHQLRAQTSTNSTSRSTMTSDLSEPRRASNASPRKDPLPLASTIVVESIRSNSASIPPDISTTTVESLITTTEDITTIDEHPIITIEDTQSEAVSTKPVHDPWIPISDEIDAALEQALDRIDSSSDTPLEFSPTTVRRTNTEVMAARLPKIPLKPGRFRQGKPIIDRSITNAANEYRPLAASQSPPNIRSPPPPPATTTNIETRHDNIFTQDDRVEPPTTTQTNENHHTTNEKTTPSRVSFRLNPDGTRVSISRPPLPTNSQSPLLSSLRRNSTDVTPLSKQV